MYTPLPLPWSSLHYPPPPISSISYCLFLAIDNSDTSYSVRHHWSYLQLIKMEITIIDTFRFCSVSVILSSNPANPGTSVSTAGLSRTRQPNHIASHCISYALIHCLYTQVELAVCFVTNQNWDARRLFSFLFFLLKIEIDDTYAK